MTAPWECVVLPDQVYREATSGVLFEVLNVKKRRHDADCDVRIRPVEATDAEAKVVLASALCAGDTYERLPDDDGDTVIWGGGTKIGPVGAR